MKKLFYFLVVNLIALNCVSQYTYRIKADSIRLHNASCNAELIIENSTRNINGFLYNRGNGRTEFKQMLAACDDTLYMIGGDTLRINYKLSGGNVFYVSKNYVGAGAAIITGLTKASISSSNTSYTKQLLKAVPGSTMFPYPDPFSARNAALDAISSGKITSATIIVFAGNAYTVGSDNPAQNGDLNYNANSNVVADIGFAFANYTTVASLMQNKINYYFEQDAQLHYINSAYTLWMTYQENTNDRNWSSGVYGEGYFKQYYGQQKGFNASWCYVNNTNAELTFKARKIELQYWKGFYFDAIKSFYIDVDKIVAGFITVRLYDPIRTNNSNVKGYFNCPDFVYGENKIQNQFNDFWPAFKFGRSNKSDTTLMRKDMNVRLGNADICVALSDGDAFFQMRSIANANINLDINNLRQTSSIIGKVDPFSALVCTFFERMENVNLDVNISSAVTEYPLFGALKNSYADPSKPARFNLHCGLHRKLPSQVNTAEFAKRNINIMNDYVSSTVAGKLSISGTYINESTSEVVAMDYMNISKLTELRGYFKTTGVGKHVMILNGYQDKRFAIVDATLINDGTVPCIALKGSQENYNTLGGIGLNTGRTVYIKNVHANTAPDTNVFTVEDSIKVVSDLTSYY